MRMIFGILSLVFVLAAVGFNVRNELRAQKQFLPQSGASGAASGPGGGASAIMSQYQQQLNAAMKNDAASTDARASDADAAVR